jgi:hypothetical protein
MISMHILMPHGAYARVDRTYQRLPRSTTPLSLHRDSDFKVDETTAMAATIAAAVSRCLLSFEILLSALVSDGDERATAASHLARFKLWVGTLGAHRESGSRSLEYRLRDASSIKNHIASLLQDLCNSVNEGTFDRSSRRTKRTRYKPTHYLKRLGRYRETSYLAMAVLAKTSCL